MLFGLVLTVGAAACTFEPPEVNQPPGNGLGDDPAFADVVVSFVQGGQATSCTEELPVPCEAQTGSCAGNPIIGAPDGANFDLEPGASIEVGFLCHPILDRSNGDQLVADFRVHATVPPEGQAVVSVSADGTIYETINNLSAQVQTFDLSNEALDYARFVRITNTGNTILPIDSLEVLRDQ